MKLNRIIALVAGVFIGTQAFAAVNVAVESSKMPNSPTTQTFTDVNIDTLDSAIVFFGRGTTNNTVIEEGGLSIGFADGGGADLSISIHSDDAIGVNTDERTEKSATETVQLANAPTNGALANGTSAPVTDGLQLTWTDINAEELIGAFMTGNDGAADAVVLTLNNTNTVTVTHALGATADLIVALNTSSSGNANNIDSFSIGFYDVGSNTYRTMSHRQSPAATTPAISTAYWNDKISVDHDNGGTVRIGVTVSNCDTDSCDFTAAGTTADSTTDTIYLMFYNFPSGTDVQVGDFVTKTSSGTQADITGMAAAPTAVLYSTSFMPSSIAVNTTATAANEGEVIGFGAAVNNGGTELASTSMQSNETGALGTTDTKSLFSQSSISSLSSAGALGYAFGISSWDAGGVTHNYTTFDATARRVIYAAIAPGGTAASFDVDPSIATVDADTVRFSFDANASVTNVFAGVLFKDSATCTCDSIELNTCAGEINYATAAATGSAQTLDLNVTLPASDPLALNDYVICGEGASDTTVTRFNDFSFSAPTGYAYVQKSGSPAAGQIGMFDGASPAIADDDTMQVRIRCDSFQNGANANDLSVAANTTYTINTEGDQSRQNCPRRFSDYSAQAWSEAAPANYYPNNEFPVYVGLDDFQGTIDPYLFEKNVALSVPVTSMFTDAESDPLTLTVTNNIPGMSVSGGNTWSGTPTTHGAYPTVNFKATDIANDFDDETVTVRIGCRVPNVINQVAATAVTNIQAQCAFTAVAGTSQYHGSIAAGNVVSVSPDVGTLSVHDQSVTYVTSLGPAPPAGKGKKRRIGMGIDNQ
jgi:hypothetical protein